MKHLAVPRGTATEPRGQSAHSIRHVTKPLYAKEVTEGALQSARLSPRPRFGTYQLRLFLNLEKSWFPHQETEVIIGHSSLGCCEG